MVPQPRDISLKELKPAEDVMKNIRQAAAQILRVNFYLGRPPQG
jgi:hypothetical protein